MNSTFHVWICTVILFQYIGNVYYSIYQNAYNNGYNGVTGIVTSEAWCFWDESVCTHFNSCTHCSPMRRCEKMTYRWQITFPQSLSQRDTGSNMCRVLFFAKQISSDRHSLCMGGCTCAAPPAPNCVCVASVVWSGVWEQAGCCLPV